MLVTMFVVVVAAVASVAAAVVAMVSLFVLPLAVTVSALVL